MYVARFGSSMLAMTGGSAGAVFLESRLKMRFFPELWEVRNAVWGEAS